ncbi:MAG TPA: ABC transporter substrate-binding protein [Candidatus Acidoferrales bacterium]|nr:ABC transporter substrate-binding protein [Candidatus Acidoferrales bacterium]
MADYEPIEIRAFYRSHSHLPLWEVIEKAGIWEKLNIEWLGMEYCGSPPEAEAALFDGKIDFISGNHITPYALVARGKPIVCIASPSNSVRDKLVSRAPIRALAELRGKRIADLAMEGRVAGFNHVRGNHMIYLLRAGLRLDEVKWVDIGEDMTPAARKLQFELLQSGGADATFVTGDTRAYEEAGFHVLELHALPMINGPTLTTSTSTLKRKDRLGERFVKAIVMGIHFARTRREETERILDGLRRRVPEASSARAERLARMPVRPYPLPEAVMHAHELCLLKDKAAEELSPLALWDVHYLREVDESGFIDGLYGGRVS